MGGGAMHFGQVEFDAARGRLFVAGAPVELDRPSIAILSVLLNEAGRDVGKDRLLEAGWPGQLVHENSLAKAISRLRRALGEDGAALETVHRYGYRLNVDVQEKLEQATAPQPRPRRLVPWAAALGLAGAAVAGLAVFSGELRGFGKPSLSRGEPADAIGRVLWVDDHPENNARERRYFERRKIAVYQVRSSEEALALLAMYEYRAVISDMNRHDRPLAGLEFVREMRRRGDDTPFYLYTVVPSAAQRGLLAQAGGQGATATPETLYAAVLPLFEQRAKKP